MFRRIIHKAALFLCAVIVLASQSFSSDAVVSPLPGAAVGTDSITPSVHALQKAVRYADLLYQTAAATKIKSLRVDAKRLLFGRKGDRLELVVFLRPSNTDRSALKFLTSDPKVATVSRNGMVRARGYGRCFITVKAGALKKKIPVQVAKKWIAITWDDGPGTYTEKLLESLDRMHVPCTFFVVGTMCCPDNHQKLLRRMRKDGHEIGNHSWAHVGTKTVIRASVKKTDTAVHDATGLGTALLRPPGGAINPNTKKCRKPIILWSVDPKDWRYRNAKRVKEYILSHAYSGSIVLLHDIHKTSVQGGLDAIRALKKEGYAFLTVSQLLGDDLKDGVTYTKGAKKVRTMKFT
ncbi:MAG: polysaccharide deacetylase family protein [Clostridiales Family XIII bacterium]|jgi:peptidoglycan/xylan/chitin deacetylase (PgdA/CDA1 family)|nr:polysaccharide deacetylase family protein [Clostridiales Family XIII bacterium]